MNDSDRRASSRAPARKLACITREDGEIGMYEVIDLSPGGMRVKADDGFFDVDERFHVEIDVENLSVEATGQVVHAADGEVGVRFTAISPDHSAQIEVFVLEHGWS